MANKKYLKEAHQHWENIDIEGMRIELDFDTRVKNVQRESDLYSEKMDKYRKSQTKIDHVINAITPVTTPQNDGIFPIIILGIIFWYVIVPMIFPK